MYRKMLCVFAMFALFVSACKKDDNSGPFIDPATVSAGTWKVSLFSDSGKDETASFAGYAFTFKSSGAASAIKSIDTTNGSWSINSSSTKFNLNFGAKSDSNKPLGELTDDWVIVSSSSTEIKLKDDNEGSGEVLTFTKN